MSNPLLDIKNQLGSAQDNLLEAFGVGKKNTEKRYPGGFNEFINVIDRGDTNWKESKGYEFQVVKADLTNATGWKPFKLQINPQELSQDEIFAIQVTPTFKGILVEHQGLTLRDIVISGTTGLSPLRGSGGALSTGRPAFGSGHSGFEEFHELRNYFRVYAEAKRRPKSDKNPELRMIFRNLKDKENLIVEPQRFKLKRSSAKSTLYNYTIEMKGIGRETYNPPGKGNWIDKTFAFLDAVETGFSDASKIIKGALGFVKKTKRDVADTILGPLDAAVGLIQTFRNEGQQIIDETTSFFNVLNAQARILENDLLDALGRENEQWNATQGRIPTVRGLSGRVSTYEELQVLNAVQKIKKGCALMTQDNSLFQKDASSDMADVEILFGNKIKIPSPNAVKEIEIDGNDTIQTLAARELDDPDRFREIVILNGLKPPYISATGGEGVLKPGDKIVIPQDDGDSSGASGVTNGKEYNITKDMQPFEKAFGVDFVLTEDFDIAISNTGDLDLLAGYENLGQALGLRILLDKGSLKRHRGIGTLLAIGEKATANAEDIRIQLEESINSDPRIDTIPFTEVNVEGNVTRIKMVLNVKDVDMPIPLSITI
jgi:hypothetical protein